MVVITLEKCPLALRGDLTKWLQEISLGVYVGHVSARVRDKLWERVCEESKNGRATMVYSARNEQHLNFKVHNTTWEPMDFDGLKLIMRPSAARTRKLNKRHTGWNDASQRAARQKKGTGRCIAEPADYTVIDIETTGLDPSKDEIIELAALKVVDRCETERFQQVVAIKGELRSSISDLTGLTSDILTCEGKRLDEALGAFLSFVGTSLVVAHNVEFDCAFIQAACETCDFDDFDNESVDTLALAKKKLPNATSYRLEALAKLLHLDNEKPHRAQPDCVIARQLFLKLIEM